MEWQVTFVGGFFVGWFGRALAIFTFNKFSKKNKSDGDQNGRN